VYPAKDEKRGSVGIDLGTGIRQHLNTLSDFLGPLQLVTRAWLTRRQYISEHFASSTCDPHVRQGLTRKLINYGEHSERFSVKRSVYDEVIGPGMT